MSLDPSRLDERSRQIMAVASSIADRQQSRRITWRHVLIAAIKLTPVLGVKLRAISVSEESLSADQMNVGDAQLGGPRAEADTSIPLAPEIASAIAKSDGTPTSLACNVVKENAAAIAEMMGSEDGFELVLGIACDPDSWRVAEGADEHEVRAIRGSRSVSRMIGPDEHRGA